jgi:hypothetical protein
LEEVKEAHHGSQLMEVEEDEDEMCIVKDENEEVTLCSHKDQNRSHIFGGGSFREPKLSDDNKGQARLIKHVNTLVIKAVSSKKTVPSFYLPNNLERNEEIQLKTTSENEQTLEDIEE